VSLILHIETATTVCSVALSRENELIGSLELDEGYTHAENLHVFIDELLKSSKAEPGDLAAIAISRGPGSYTGLRIGTSAAKGLSYALGIPLIAVDTLQVMTAHAIGTQGEPGVYYPMIDARRMEVYTAAYDHALNQLKPVEALIIDPADLSRFRAGGKLFFFGNGMEKCRETLGSLGNATFIPDIKPLARFMTDLSWQRFRENRFEDLASFEPLYLKDFIAGGKQK
jgi:tRNA threonylcarbamoyladenosine biosynthesis protein TsaB